MLKRSVATVGWFMATWCFYELAVYFVDAPRIGGPLLGAAVSAFVGLDPLDAIWTPTGTDGAPRRDSPALSLVERNPA